jgi:hypothetical protein
MCDGLVEQRSCRKLHWQPDLRVRPLRKKLFLLFLSMLSADVLAQNASSPTPTTPQAQLRLRNDYLNEKDYANAMIWFRKAADRGNSPAQNNIGWLYQNGWGGKKDYAEAANHQLLPRGGTSEFP